MQKTLTFPACTDKQKSLRIFTFGRVGYLKLTCLNSMFPITDAGVLPDISNGLIFDLRSSNANTELTAVFAFVISGSILVD